MRRIVVGGLLTFAACSRPAPAGASGNDASGPRAQTVRVPAALIVSRGLDTLTVSVDAASLAETDVTVDPGMRLGVESETRAFAVGQQPPVAGRKAYGLDASFSLGAQTWNLRTDGIPRPGTRYVAEMRLVLFETDAPTQQGGDPHAGRYKALWTRTLRQAEE